jgi:hypothetical protein
MKGISYTGWSANVYFSPASDESLARARQAGCDWVEVTVWWFQDNINSTVIAPDYSPQWYSATPESVIHAIQRCHQLGMKVMLKALVDLKTSTHWRGEIVPSNAWFNSYHSFMNFWADIATANNVELFCVGCELTKTESYAGLVDGGILVELGDRPQCRRNDRQGLYTAEQARRADNAQLLSAPF